ncbi:hypothetical protein FRB99_000115 [Tulasnella sp. 403]|nr:hypothetical protein FRB99_000115 [Tulasnella sp. 403]
MKAFFVFGSFLLLTSPASAWFGSDQKPEYEGWDTQKLHHWLESKSINVPEGYGRKDLQKLVASNWESHKEWTQEMYDAAKARFEGIQASTFDTWNESQLRTFLVEQGMVAPSGPREQLVLSAKQQYNAYAAAAASLSARASAAASTAVYGDSTYQASKSLSSAATQASQTGSTYAADASRSAAAAYATASAFANRKLDDSKDYVYSTWDDNRLRSFLEEKGVIKTKQQATRDELLAKMRDAYLNPVVDPVYNAWNDSYMREWLIAHGIVKSDYERQRDEYMALLQRYYYAPQDKVWSAWSDSETKAWLVKNNIVKSDAQIQREKMQNLVAKNYYSAHGTAWAAWSDSSMKKWLVDHGYLRSDAQTKRDQLVKLMNDKYADTSAKTAEYLTWPDARLRAYLRSWGVDDTQFGSRPTLLQEVRIRYYQTNNKVEQLLTAIREKVYAGVEEAEAMLTQIYDMLGGAKHDAQNYASEKSHDAKKYAAQQAADKAASAEASAASLRKEAENQREEL